MSLQKASEQCHYRRQVNNVFVTEPRTLTQLAVDYSTMRSGRAQAQPKHHILFPFLRCKPSSLRVSAATPTQNLTVRFLGGQRTCSSDNYHVHLFCQVKCFTESKEAAVDTAVACYIRELHGSMRHRARGKVDTEYVYRRSLTSGLQHWSSSQV